MAVVLGRLNGAAESFIGVASAMAYQYSPWGRFLGLLSFSDGDEIITVEIMSDLHLY